MPDEDVAIELHGEWVHILGARARFRFRTLDPRGYPEPPPSAIGHRFVSMRPGLFRRAVELTAFASLRNSSQGWTKQCVNVAVSDDKIVFTATDGARLAQFVAEVATVDFECAYGSVLIPPYFLLHLCRLARDSTVKMCIDDDNRAVFGMGDTTVVTVPLMSGSFPKVERLLDMFDQQAARYNSFNLKRGEVTAMLSRVAIMSSDDHNAARIHVGGNCVRFETSTPEIGDALCIAGARYSLPDRFVDLDLRHLTQGIAGLDRKELVRFVIGDQLLPVKLEAVPAKFFADRYTYVLMPLEKGSGRQPRPDLGFWGLGG